MRALVFNPTSSPLPTAERGVKLEVEEVTAAALKSAASALRNNPLLPILLVSGPRGEAAAQECQALLAHLRTSGYQGPLLVLTTAPRAPSLRLKASNPDSQWRADLLDLGADDVIALTDTSSREILARLNAVARRNTNSHAGSLRFGEVQFYLDGRNPEIAGLPIKLSTKEYEIFRYLALHLGQLVSKSAIYDALYALAPMPPFDKIIDVYICRLRAKLSHASPAGINYIETLSGRGYRLRNDVI